MSITNITGMTLAEFAKHDAAKNLGPVIDTCVDQDEILRFMPFVECNQGTHHATPVETGEPTVAWVTPGDFVPVSHGSIGIIKDTPALVKAWASTPTDHIRMFGHLPESDRLAAEWQKRFSEEKRFQTKMAKDVVSKIFYGDISTNVKVFDGLAKRYNTLKGDIGEQVIDYGDTGDDLTSIFMVTFGTEATTGIYPRGMIAGLRFTDLGEHVESNDIGKRSVVDGEYQWHAGIAVRNFRSVIRIANISLASLNTENNLKIVKIFNECIDRKINDGKTYFLAHRKVRTAIRNSFVDKPNHLFGLEALDGYKVNHFDGVPVLRTDSLMIGEKRVQ